MNAIYPSLRGAGVLISGGASGIGAAMVAAFAAQGARVTFLDIDDVAGETLAPIATYRRCDVTDIAALRVAIAATEAEYPISVLINNAARDDRHPIGSVEPEQWHRTLALNLDHQFFATQAVAPLMAGRGGGAVILMGSVSWMRARTGMVGYTAAKAAINGMTKTMAREYGAAGIRVNSIVPGAILTERQAALWRTPAVDAQIQEAQALKIVLDAGHVARMALFVASAEASGCTGQNFLVDAGITLN
jgi:NAD(P)-dependent dehydrogenase (short-subunit alcohol dehydrogenase family)